jgi:hypothetical protein
MESKNQTKKKEVNKPAFCIVFAKSRRSSKTFNLSSSEILSDISVLSACSARRNKNKEL